jgi:hypothetical protein
VILSPCHDPPAQLQGGDQWAVGHHPNPDRTAMMAHPILRWGSVGIGITDIPTGFEFEKLAVPLPSAPVKQLEGTGSPNGDLDKLISQASTGTPRGTLSHPVARAEVEHRQPKAIYLRSLKRDSSPVHFILVRVMTGCV